jgi:thiol-disulfide isomerase/thioredoxin
MKGLTVFTILLLMACSQPTPDNDQPGIVSNLRPDGRWVVINYWAIWCFPCREEIPELNEFARQEQSRVAVYAVNFDEKQGEELLVQANELAIDFPLLAADPAQQLGYPRPTVLPTTVVINPEGMVVARLIGPQSVDSLTATLQSD